MTRPGIASRVVGLPLFRTLASAGGWDGGFGHGNTEGRDVDHNRTLPTFSKWEKRKLFSGLKNPSNFILTGVGQLSGAASSNRKGCNFDPWSRPVREASNQCFSLTSMFLSLPSSSPKAMEKHVLR